ncbi:MAG: alanine racemase [Crocinitomicaceae bacterium]|nr:alanine racemase [Crocinitomicaceae bacterium]
MSDTDPTEKSKLTAVLKEFEPIQYRFVDNPNDTIEPIADSVILIKGHRASHMEKLASRLRAKKHQTYVEIDLNAIKKNISYCRQLLPRETKILTMVKASSYGSGMEKVGVFLERIGVNYLGVAYADEGAELRKSGVKIPILVMNSEEAGLEECIQNHLEPSIYSFSQLDAFIKQLIYNGKSNYPIHLKIETGMNRLGFEIDQLQKLVDVLKSQPEVRVQSVYTHLADADDPNSAFIHTQFSRFETAINRLKEHIPYSFDRHILNTEGILNYPEYHMDMVRLGIGMYGYSSSKPHADKLEEAIRWYSVVSQLRKVKPGATIGYGRIGRIEKETQIAVIPVGYADGFRRTLSDGQGGVYIHNHYCPIIGNVCMDMVMVDVGHIDVHEGDQVEIIGEHQGIADLAKKMGTIPYEVMTGISKRVHRVYLED